jgi:carbon-monoxide dehydrogenase large subunit
VTYQHNTLVGQSVERVEDLRFLAGRGEFVDDISLSGMLHAVILRSPVAHARVVSIAVGLALRCPGVRAVMTAADVGEIIPTIPLRLAPLPSFLPYLQPVIAGDRVRYVGEPVAVVVADTQAQAEDALEAIEVQFEGLGAVTDDAASIAGKTLLFEAAGTNVAADYRAAKGDPDAAFAGADYQRKEKFSCHRHTAVPLETRGLIADWSDGRLQVLGATKVPFFNRRALARMLGVGEDKIDLIEVDVGGGFGVRGEFYPEDFLIPFAAMRLGKKIKWIEDRREHFLATNHSRDVDCELAIACKTDGTILGLRGRIIADMGAYIRTNGGVVPSKAAQFLPGPYRIENVGVEVLAVMTNKTPTATYRAPGRFEANFFRERLFDLAAADLGIDRVAFRKKNLIAVEEMPYSVGKLVPYEAASSYDTGDYHMTFDRCLKEIGWEEKEGLQGKRVDGRLLGTGIACFVESSGAGPKENARLTREGDGSVTIHVGSSALGQGLETTLAQIAADALELKLEKVTIRHGSTTLLAEGFGTYHSRSIVMGGSAILLGAAQMMESGAGEVEASFGNDVRTYTYGAHAAHVAVDPGTGRVEVLDYVAVEDIGRAINPAVVHGQAIGGIVQGLGGVFLDHLIYDEEGQLLNASLADYLLPTATDFPTVRAVTLQVHRSPSNPLGVKGAGEGGIVVVAAAIANAVAAAVGKNICKLPLSPAAVWAVLQEPPLCR